MLSNRSSYRISVNVVEEGCKYETTSEGVVFWAKTAREQSFYGFQHHLPDEEYIRQGNIYDEKGIMLYSEPVEGGSFELLLATS